MVRVEVAVGGMVAVKVGAGDSVTVVVAWGAAITAPPQAVKKKDTHKIIIDKYFIEFRNVSSYSKYTRNMSP
jgi:xanthine dehydrogenase iron-sulfur cluster and FAD-binding subunit A